MIGMLQRTLRATAMLLIAALPQAALAEPVTGSGSTFAFPLIASWSEGYLIDRHGGTDYVTADSGVFYEPIGSVGGIQRLSQPQVDFAASDVPLTHDTLVARGLAQFPIVIGGLAVVVNLPDVESGALKLPRDALADIFLGRITAWNDPALAAANPGIALPDLPIAVISRLDGSGSTYAFTRYLTRASADWQQRLGSDTLIDWPTGISVKGSGRIIAAVQTTRGAISYVEYGQASRAGLAIAAVQDVGGTYVLPSAETISATAAGADWDGAEDFSLNLTDVDGPGTYPLTTATFALMRRGDRPARTLETLYFFNYGLERGGDRARGLSYVPLPDAVVAQVQDYWRKTLPGADSF